MSEQPGAQMSRMNECSHCGYERAWDAEDGNTVVWTGGPVTQPCDDCLAWVNSTPNAYEVPRKQPPREPT